MPAQITRLSLDVGIRHFHCGVCGNALIDDQDGLREVLCDHVFAVVDWIGELTIGPATTPELAEALEKIFENDDGDVVEALAKVLPNTVVFFDFVEPARGGGHDGSSIAIAVDFASSGQQRVKG